MPPYHHVSLGTEAAAQLKLERFNKETTSAQNKKAIQLLRDAGLVGIGTDLGRVGYWGPQSKKKVDLAFDTACQFERPSAAAVADADADAGWVTMHGPKIEHKRRQGELNAAMACGGGNEQRTTGR